MSSVIEQSSSFYARYFQELLEIKKFKVPQPLWQRLQMSPEQLSLF
ncbi:MAG: hypothetical protein GPI96_12000 [Microcystis aeruginosa BS13-02]|nr:hypothetical protein [Microcystis aeruginosa BS13-02]